METSVTSEEVRTRRQNAKIRQDRLARKLGWNSETIIDIDRGRIQVSEHTLRQMDSAIDQIIHEENQQREGVKA